MGPTRHTGEYLTAQEVDRPLTAEEDRSFKVLDSPLGRLFAREHQAFMEADGPAAAERNVRMRLLQRFHDRMDHERHLAPRAIAVRYVSDGLQEWICEHVELPLENRVELFDLLVEARDAYLASSGVSRGAARHG